jgi:hypothetical protein
MHGRVVDTAQQLVGSVGRTRVAPAENRRQRLPRTVESKQAVPERRRSCCVIGPIARRLLEDLAHELDDACGIALTGVVTPSGVTLVRLGVEDLRTNGRRSDVEREDPRHDPTITSGGGYAGNHDDR